MNQLQLRLEVKAAAQNWVAAIMQQYEIPASIMEDALQSVQLSLKDLIAQELITELQKQQQVSFQEDKKEEEKENGESQSNN